MPPWTTPARGPGPDRLVIGRFARLTGLSVGALRHYDELDLLRPRWVDPETGYRSYGRDQLETARTIVRLRDLELPLEEIRAYLGTDDPAERRRILLEHRRRIEARTFRLQGVLHVVGQLAGATTSTTTAKETLPMTAPTLEFGRRRRRRDPSPPRRRPVQPRLDPARAAGPQRRPRSTR